MQYPGFVGPTNATQSPMADAEQLVNFYVEPVGSQAAPSPGVLLPTPGQTPFLTTSSVGTRGFINIGTRAFTVIGTGFYEVFEDGTSTLWGTVMQDNYPATLSYNGVTGGQLFITSGGNGYLFVLASNTLSTISALVGKATQGGAKDGFFLCFDINTSTVFLSDLNDGATWDPTQYFQRSLAPDPWKAMVVSNPEIWMIGEVTGEAWYNAGNFPQPFAPIPGAFFQFGTRAPFSATLAGATLIWLANTVDGFAGIVAARGYSPQSISTYAVDTALAAYARAQKADDCEALVYQEAGHLFVCFNFAAAQATWVVDLQTNLWHKRGTWNTSADRYDVWSPRVHMQAFGQHLVGDRSSGTICRMDLTIGTEADGTPIRRLRTPPPIWARNNKRLVIGRLELNMDTGLGLANGQGSAPVVLLRSSINTRTWGAQTQRGAGRIGKYGTRVVWTRVASSMKVWMPEIVVADPIPYRIAGCEITGSGFEVAA